MSEDETKTEEIQQVEKDEITEQAWWRESAFVYKGETETVESSGAVLKPNTLFDTLVLGSVVLVCGPRVGGNMKM